VVAPVWGERHRRRFLDIVLPSWLALGNLPTLATRRRLTVKIATRAGDIATFEDDPAFKALCRLASVEFVLIDDLLTSGNVFVTLTLAYQRGLRRAAEGGVFCAILLNADFILAQTSLCALLDTLDGGAEAVLAPSLRVNEEEAFEYLRAAVGPDGALSRSSRDLVALALSALHPTAMSSRVDQHAIQSLSPHQLFWRPEAGTLIGRAFCLFPLAILVKGGVGPAETFCDYGLTSLLAPDAHAVVMADSDGFFALEMAPLDHELRFFRLGAATPKTIADRLAGWSTSFHREQAGVPIFYRSADPGPGAPRAVEASARYVEEILRHLPPPQPIRNHPHWLAAVALWRTNREERGFSDDPPELGAAPDVRTTPTTDPIRRLSRTLLVGRPEWRTALHPRWRLTRAIARRTPHARLNGSSLLLGRTVLSELIAVTGSRTGDGRSGDTVWLAIDPSRPDALADLRQLAGSTLSTASSATLLLLGEGDDSIRPQDLAAVLSLLEANMDLTGLQAFDLRLDDRVRHVHGRLADRFSKAGWPSRFRMAAASASALIFMTVINLERLLRETRPPPRHVSAVLIDATRRGG
jgi:hypothetical protein